MEKQQKITQRYFQHVLRRYRMAMGLSQEQMSERIGVSKGFYSMMEIGRKWPNVDMIFRIAEAIHKCAGRRGEKIEFQLGCAIAPYLDEQPLFC